MQESKQELPIGYSLDDPHANHPQVIAREKFMQTEAHLPCPHYNYDYGHKRVRYNCALCQYDFYMKERDSNE